MRILRSIVCTFLSLVLPFEKKTGLSRSPSLSLLHRSTLLSVRVSNNARATLAPFRDTPFAHARMTRTPTTLTAASIYLLVSGSRPLPEFFITVVAAAARRYQRPTRGRIKAAGGRGERGNMRGWDFSSTLTPAIASNTSPWEDGNAIVVSI